MNAIDRLPGLCPLNKTVVDFDAMPRKRLFISHISDEGSTAARIKEALDKDFLGLLDVFVSSDTESIAAGEEWLGSIEVALKSCAIFVVLCSPESIRRPWINFEAGAAWMLKIPIIPVCHLGLLPRDLRMPLSLRQGTALDDPEGLQRFYDRVSKELECRIPARNFRDLAIELASKDSKGNASNSEPSKKELRGDRAAQERLLESLSSPKFRWRSLERVAAEAGLSEEKTADLLRADPKVRFGKGKSSRIIVGLRSRVD
jgi:TIR domain-containing protein